jgi:hypothetical protein
MRINRTEEDRRTEDYERNRAKFRGKANLYRRQAETILKVLEWAAPDRHREKRLRAGYTGEERRKPPQSAIAYKPL